MTDTDELADRDVREAIKPGALRHERRRRLAERAKARRSRDRREVYVCSLPLRHQCHCTHTEEAPDAATTTHQPDTQEDMTA